MAEGKRKEKKCVKFSDWKLWDEVQRLLESARTTSHRIREETALPKQEVLQENVHRYY